MTVETLSMIAGALLSLGFTYIPGLNAWFASKAPSTKQLVMLALLALTASGLVTLSCAGLVELPLVGLVTCDRAGILKMVELLILAVIANQGTDRISPEPRNVRSLKGIGRAKQTRMDYPANGPSYFG